MSRLLVMRHPRDAIVRDRRWANISHTSCTRSSTVACPAYTTLAVTRAILTYLYSTRVHTCCPADPVEGGRRVSTTVQGKRKNVPRCLPRMRVLYPSPPALVRSNTPTTNGVDQERCLRNRSWGIRRGQTRAVERTTHAASHSGSMQKPKHSARSRCLGVAVDPHRPFFSLCRRSLEPK